MTVTRLAAVGGAGARGRQMSWGGVAPALSDLARNGPAPAAAATPPATECGRQWRTWPGSTCRWGSRTWGG